jgi:hypothetical protein
MYLEAGGTGMPVLQRNANLENGLLVRVGIPHSGGKLAFHAFNEGYARMVSASAFWNPKTGRFRIPDPATSLVHTARTFFGTAGFFLGEAATNAENR